MTGLASKPEETGLTGLGLKTGGGLDAVKVRAEGTWRHREAYVEAKRSREGGVSVRCSSKKLDDVTPLGCLDCMFNGRAFGRLAGYLYRESGIV